MTFIINEDCHWDLFNYVISSTTRYMFLYDGTGSRSNFWPQICTFLTDWTGDSGSFHFSLGIDNDTSVIFKVYENSVLSSPSSSLSNDYGWHDFLSKIRFPLSNRAHNHVSDRGCWESVQATFAAFYSKNV